MIKVAFDVDGTLLDEAGQPRWDIIGILRALVPYCTVIVWSGSGLDYAKSAGRVLFLPPEVIYQSKMFKEPVDVAFDDQNVQLAAVNINAGDQEGKLWATT
jgi:hypothetical protein